MIKLHQWLAGARRRWRTPHSAPSRAAEEEAALRLALLEDRILYSAAPLAPDAPVDDAPAEGDELSAFDDAELLAALPEDEPLTVKDQPLADDDATVSARELVVIDRAVENYQQLVHDLTTGADGRQFDLLYLDADVDGVEAITRALDGRTIYDSIHLVSHGKPGAVKLGAVWLESGNLAGYAGDLVQWRSGLADGADLLIYGCDLAADHSGRSLVEALSELTGADAAASDDDTGHASRGGDWELEYVIGDLETSVAFSLAVQAEWTGEMAASTTGTLFWRANGDGSPNYSEWDGVALGPEGDTAGVGGWRIMEGAEAPTRDEIILVGVNGSEIITGQMWDGSSWSGLPFNDLATVSTSTYHGFDVAYESRSGEAMLVWNNGAGGAAPLSYRVWDGSTWSAEQTIAAPTAGEAYEIRLAASPVSDEMVLIVSNNNADEYALVWNGSSWGNSVVLDTGNPGQRTEIAVAYEAQSGQALVVYDAILGGGGVNYRTWNGASWSAEGTVNQPAGANAFNDARFSVLASDATSDRIVLGVVSGGASNETWFAIWDGSVWDSHLLAASSGANSTVMNTAAAFESQSGTLYVAYGDTSNVLQHRTWTSDGGWSGPIAGPNLGTTPNSMAAYSDPAQDHVLFVVQDDSRDLHLVDNFTATEFETNTGETALQPFVFMFDRLSPPVVTMPGGAVDYAENDPATVIDPAATVTDSDSPDFDGGALTIDFSAGGTADDRLEIRDQGAGAGNVILSGADVQYDFGAGAVTVGTFSGGTDGSTPLVVTFNANATPGAVQAVLRNVAFRNVSDDPATASRTVRFSLTDGDGGVSNTVTETINVTAVNDAPVLTPVGPAATGITEDETSSAGDLVSAIVGASISDADSGAAEGIAVTGLSSGNGAWQYSLDDGASWSDVGAVADNSALLLRAVDRLRFVPDGLNADSASVTYRAWDQTSGAAGTKADATITGGDAAFSTAQDTASITVTAVNDAPTITSDGGGATATLNVAENTLAVTTVAASDPDLPADTLTYSISGGADAARFSVDAASGELTFNAPPDYEAPADANGDNIYEVTVQVSDAAGGLASQAISVAVTEVNEFDVGPSDDTDAAADAVDENAANGAAVGITAFAEDADATNNTIAYSLDDAAGGRFAIDAATGVVTVADGTLLDRETAASHDIAVRATSADGSFSTRTFTISLNDVDEFDVGTISDVDAAADAVDEHAANGTAVGISAFAEELDATNNAIAYSLDDDAGGRFAIDAITGVVTVADGTLLDRESAASHDITLRATSADGSFSMRSFTIGVNPVNDTAPVIIANSLSIAPPPSDSGVPAPPNDSDNEEEDSTILAMLQTQEEREDEMLSPATHAASSRGYGGLEIAGGGKRDADAADLLVDDLLGGAGFVAWVPAYDGPGKIGAAGRSGDPASEAGASSHGMTAADFQMLWQRLDTYNREVELELQYQTIVAGAAMVLTSSAAAGYVLWSLRAGTLMAGFITSLPAWATVDVLAVADAGCAAAAGRDGERESLVDLVTRRTTPSPTGNGTP